MRRFFSNVFLIKKFQPNNSKASKKLMEFRYLMKIKNT